MAPVDIYSTGYYYTGISATVYADSTTTSGSYYDPTVFTVTYTEHEYINNNEYVIIKCIREDEMYSRR